MTATVDERFEIAIDALKYYANKSLYVETDEGNDIGFFYRNIDDDQGAKARAALKAIRQEKGDE